MENQIKRYPVQHPLLREYVSFFWELHINQAQLNHKLVPQRNINMRFNLSDTSHRICRDNDESLLEDVYFPGLQSQFTNSYLKIDGEVDVIGVCFKPDGLYPFVKIPVSEFKNQILGAGEVGFINADRIFNRLKETAGTTNRLSILEYELLSILQNSNKIPEKFRLLFNALKQESSIKLAEFCKQENIGLRQLERMYLKYVGLSASTYTTLNRFHITLNQLLKSGYTRLSDLAYDNEYFDQMHFIREFKRFTGNTPGKFIKQNNSILQIGKLN